MFRHVPEEVASGSSAARQLDLKPAKLAMSVWPVIQEQSGCSEFVKLGDDSRLSVHGPRRGSCTINARSMREYDLIADWFPPIAAGLSASRKRSRSPPRFQSVHAFWMSAAATACRSPRRS
jgi:hypothetical protein